MRIADICTQRVIHVDVETSVRVAAELMRTHHVGSLVVVEQPNGERVPVGILTDRDIVVAVIAPGVSPDALTVGDAMTPSPATCSDDDELLEAIGIMRERGVRRLPVVNRSGGLSGMVSVDDIYGALGTHMRELGRALTREQVREMETRA